MDMSAPPEINAPSPVIHPTAVVSNRAVIGPGVHIGPYALVEADTEIGAGSQIGAFAVIKSFSRLGRAVKVHEQAIIGGLPQDHGFRGDTSYVDIGDQTEIREQVTIHRASKPGGSTRIGANCLLMIGAHVAHDCQLEDWVILTNNVQLAGHVSIGTRAIIAGQSAIHQFCRIGRLAMVSGLTGVNMDVLPFCTVQGAPAKVRGLNLVGLRRAGFSGKSLRELKQAYRAIFQDSNSRQASLDQLQQLGSAEALEMAAFIEASSRGITHPQKAAVPGTVA